jgi:integrase
MLRRRARIVEALYEDRGGLRFGPPKTKQSIRAIALPSFVADALAAHLDAFPPGSEGFVFTTGARGSDRPPKEAGGPVRPSNFRHRIWHPAVKRAGIAPPRPRVHDLRHTAAALAIQAGAHPKQIQEQLGHSSITVTLDRYGHLFESLAEELAARLDLLWSPRPAEQMRNRAVGEVVSLEEARAEKGP